MRLRLTTLAAILLLCTPALAGSAYNEVSTEHWAYNALDYLQHHGYLQNYPAKVFDGSQVLKRDEFQFAILQLQMATADTEEENVPIMVETLRAEFSDLICFSGIVNLSEDPSGDPVPAESAPETGWLSSDHWVLNAFDYLQTEGYLQNFPANYFTNWKSLSRRNAAVVVNQLFLDLPEQPAVDEVIMATTLHHELADVDWIADCPFEIVECMQPDMVEVTEATEVPTSAYDDVPQDHWAYSMLNSYAERGLLEGYPHKFFASGSLTRYELAQAVMRIISDNVLQIDEPYSLGMLLLHQEFNKEINAQNGMPHQVRLDFSELEGWAASRKADPSSAVVPDHWAFNSLEYLQMRGYLAEYPRGIFRIAGEINRHDLAVAVRCLCGSLDDNSPTDILIMAEALRHEFEDLLPDVNFPGSGYGIQRLSELMSDSEGQQ
ncbi:hypothetical protein KDL29_03610 [bacterium]|nr:hypothetical protein [bacterium]